MEKNIRTRFFMAAFAVSFLLLAVMAMAFVLLKDSSREVLGTPAVSVPIADDTALTGKAVNVLLVDSYDGTAARTFMVLHIDPQAATISVLTLPGATQLELSGALLSLNEIYGSSGISAVTAALNNNLGISVSRYILSDSDSFITAINTLGTIRYDLPYTVFYQEADYNVNITAGSQLFDAKMISDVMRYPQHMGGELGRVSLITDIAVSLLNQKFLTLTGESSESLFLHMVNSFETNISYSDYVGSLTAAEKMAFSRSSPATSVAIYGQFDSAGNYFLLSETSIRLIQSVFNGGDLGKAQPVAQP